MNLVFSEFEIMRQIHHAWVMASTVKRCYIKKVIVDNDEILRQRTLSDHSLVTYLF